MWYTIDLSERGWSIGRLTHLVSSTRMLLGRSNAFAVSSAAIALNAGETWCNVSITPRSHTVSPGETHSVCTALQITVSRILCSSSFGRTAARELWVRYDPVFWESAHRVSPDSVAGSEATFISPVRMVTKKVSDPVNAFMLLSLCFVLLPQSFHSLCSQVLVQVTGIISEFFMRPAGIWV